MTLTAKQEAFCQAIADGMNQSDAYRKAYDAEEMKPITVIKRASELMANGDIAGRVASLRAKLEEKALWSRQDSVQALRSIVLGSEAKPSEVVAAVRELNSMHGYEAPKKTDMRVTGGLVIVPSKDGWE